MLQKWIKPLKIPVSTFYIITFINCSLTSQRSMIWSWVNTRTQTNKPWNWSTCWCAESLFSRTLRHQLKPGEQHRFQLDKTPVCSQFLTAQGLMGFHWQHNKLPQLEAHREVSCTYWENTQTATAESHGWLPMARHWPGRQWNPHLYIHPHKSLLFHGALNVIWDQLFDRNCTSLCTWRYF